MPFLLLPLVLLLPLAFVLLLPFSIVQRYRVGTARRMAHPWLATLNVSLISVSAFLFAVGAAVMNLWVPEVFVSAIAGLTGGGILALFGLKLTRWEPAARGLHYTPNRVLVLLITVAVTARIAFGFWRMWHAWEHTAPGDSWVAASGAAGSLGVGGIVLGYYLVYWAGVRRRVRRHRAANSWNFISNRTMNRRSP